MLQRATAKYEGRLKEYVDRAIRGPRPLIVGELRYLPFGLDEADLFFKVVAKALRARLDGAHQQPAVRPLSHGAG